MIGFLLLAYIILAVGVGVLFDWHQKQNKEVEAIKRENQWLRDWVFRLRNEIKDIRDGEA